MSNVKNVRKKNLQKKKKNKNDNYNQFFIPLLPSHPCHRKKQRTSLYAKKKSHRSGIFSKNLSTNDKISSLKKIGEKAQDESTLVNYNRLSPEYPCPKEEPHGERWLLTVHEYPWGPGSKSRGWRALMIGNHV